MGIKTLAENICLDTEERIKTISNTVYLELYYDGGGVKRTVLKNLDEAIELCNWMVEDEIEAVAETFAKNDEFF